MKITAALAVFILFLGLFIGFFWPLWAVGGGFVCAMSMLLMDGEQSRDSDADGLLAIGMFVGFAVFVYSFVISLYKTSLVVLGG